MKVLSLTDRDQRWNGITYNGKLHKPIPRLRKRCGFKRQCRNLAPIHQSSQRTIRHDGDDECLIRPIPFAEPLQAAFGVDVFLIYRNYNLYSICWTAIEQSIPLTFKQIDARVEDFYVTRKSMAILHDNGDLKLPRSMMVK